MPDLLLNVRGFETQFRTPDGVVHVANGVSFDLKEVETLDILGKSGCGRNVAMLSVLGLIPDSPGKFTVEKTLF
jgi:ABC-type dipeptide/oligopeptide/nickel transport system ATPase component